MNIGVLNFLIIFLILLSFKSFSQSSITPAEQLEHEKAVFEDSETGGLFWPQELPVFIRLATSPDDNAPTFLLDNVETGNGNFENNTEGIKLELTGSQFVRWVNMVTKDDIKYKFFSDGEPPIISHKFNDAPKYVSGKKVFFGKGLNCTFSSTDKLSGVKELYVSIDGSAYVANKSAVDFNTEKVFFVQYYAVDKVGYFNKAKTIEFIVDLTAPVTKHTIETNFIDNILSSKTTIQLTSEDNSSGVRKIYYKFDNQNKFSTYTGKINISKLANGEHKIIYYSVDNVKNEEIYKEYSFYLDKENPKPTISTAGSKHTRAGSIYVSALSLIKFAATDDKSEVKKILYAINNTSKYTKYENPFPLSLKSGSFYVSYYSVDKLDNTSDKKTQKYMMDLVPPVTKHKIVGPRYVQRNTTIWVTKDTKILLSSTDEGAGVSEISFALGKESQKVYTDAIQVTTEENILCRFWSKDYVGNREGDNVLLLIGDNSAPEITEIFSVKAIDKTSENVGIYPQYTSLFLAATDMSSGLKEVWYSLNGASEKKYTTAILLEKPGKYEIDIRATDNLGQESKKNIKFEIKKLSVDDY